MRGSYLQDSVPRFPQPFDILLQRSELELALSMPVSTPSITNICEDAAVARICNYLQQVNEAIDLRYSIEEDSLWQDVLFPHYNMAPIMHELLSMPAVKGLSETLVRRRELFRLAAILHVAELKARFRIDRTGAEVYAAKIQTLLADPFIEYSWDLDNPLLYWILIAVSSSERIPEPVRRQCGEWLRLHAALLGSDVAGIFGELPLSLWCESAFGPLNLHVEALMYLDFSSE